MEEYSPRIQSNTEQLKRLDRKLSNKNERIQDEILFIYRIVAI